MGTLPGLCYLQGMTCYLNHHKVRIFDYPKFAQPYRDSIRENAKNLARENGIKIHHIRNPNTDKGEVVKSQLKKLKKKGRAVEGLFYIISAQEISDSFNVKALHSLLDDLVETFCPIVKSFGIKYHWSVMQVEYSTDIVFRKQKDLKEIYDHLVATAVHTVKPDRIATFLGRKIYGQFKGEMGNRYDVRKEGIRIKHTMGKIWIKMYDKYKKVLRIEIVATDISFFKHYRKVEHRDGSTSKKFTSMKKNIYSLGPFIKVASDANRRYLEFISTIEKK